MLMPLLPMAKTHQLQLHQQFLRKLVLNYYVMIPWTMVCGSVCLSLSPSMCYPNAVLTQWGFLQSHDFRSLLATGRIYFKDMISRPFKLQSSPFEVQFSRSKVRILAFKVQTLSAIPLRSSFLRESGSMEPQIIAHRQAFQDRKGHINLRNSPGHRPGVLGTPGGTNRGLSAGVPEISCHLP